MGEFGSFRFRRGPREDSTGLEAGSGQSPDRYRFSECTAGAASGSSFSPWSELNESLDWRLLNNLFVPAATEFEGSGICEFRSGQTSTEVLR